LRRWRSLLLLLSRRRLLLLLLLPRQPGYCWTYCCTRPPAGSLRLLQLLLPPARCCIHYDC
jgi:hypothetical protein